MRYYSVRDSNNELIDVLAYEENELNKAKHVKENLKKYGGKLEEISEENFYLSIHSLFCPQ